MTKRVEGRTSVEVLDAVMVGDTKGIWLVTEMGTTTIERRDYS